MGPPSEDDGKLAGHGYEMRDLYTASMGPPSEDDEKIKTVAPCLRPPCQSGFNGAAVRGRRKVASRKRAPLSPASMGPPSEDDGKRVAREQSHRPRGASMGPPSEDDGKKGRVRLLRKDGRKGLQWGRRPRTTESPPRLPPSASPLALGASMGPPSEDDGKWPPG